MGVVTSIGQNYYLYVMRCAEKSDWTPTARRFGQLVSFRTLAVLIRDYLGGRVELDN